MESSAASSIESFTRSSSDQPIIDLYVVMYVYVNEPRFPEFWLFTAFDRACDFVRTTFGVDEHNSESEWTIDGHIRNEYLLATDHVNGRGIFIQRSILR